MTSVEKELKYQLSRKEYVKLLAALQPPKKVLVTEELANSYFDDSKFTLRKHRLNLRLRVADKQSAQLTLKYPGRSPSESGPASFRVRHEVESRISLNTAKSVLSGKKKVDAVVSPAIRALRTMAPDLGPGRLKLLGTLTTWRTQVEFESFPLEIDMCELFDRTFFELEIETDRPKIADRKVRKLFEQLGIRYRHGVVSKSGRFFKALKKEGSAS